eukprot:CAMPEP_0194262578 /NCGR_PEP_ID=MMETSP0158-20130606/46617_1 /TAXON_ID=33649 /ORGANISM="Thalassionema nitzschioides, Strain L26-B" /LENGTH=437 /DNA_ID=CAMNT_0039002737 /DNA_START=1 /DNA_END=1314 /DNA_ORIENTATION=-
MPSHWNVGNNFYFTKAGFVIPIISGFISFLSSFFVLSIIWKSGRLSSGYHLIMAFMSMSDIMASFAVSMTTLPMPRDVIYPFEGPSYGTTRTCTAQGLVYAIGTALSLSMNVFLAVYFLLRVRFRVTEISFKRRIFPIMFLVILVLMVVYLPFYGLQVYNPSPYRSYCTVSDYPYGCNEDPEVECIRFGHTHNSYFDSFKVVVLISLPVFFLTMVVSLGLIILTYYQNSRSLREARRQHRQVVDEALVEMTTQEDENTMFAESSSRSSADEEALARNEGGSQRFQELQRFYQQESHFKNFISVLTLQALLYIGAFLVTWLPALLNFIGDLGEVPWLQALKLIFQPLHGFFNMLVFVYCKLSHIRRLYPGSTYRAGFKVLWCAPDIIPEIMKSRMSRVAVTQHHASSSTPHQQHTTSTHDFLEDHIEDPIDELNESAS